MTDLKLETKNLIKEINLDLEEQQKYSCTIERNLEDVSKKLSEVFHQKNNGNFELLDARLGLMQESWGEEGHDMQISFRNHVLHRYGEVIELLEQIRNEIEAEPVVTYTPEGGLKLNIESGIEQ